MASAHANVLPVMAPVPVSLVRWGPLAAGMVATLASGWLLSMIGTALGLSIADARDVNSTVAFDGLGVGAVAWMLVSWSVAFFIGGATAGRLLESPDDTLGKVHGFTLWSLGSVLWIVVALVGATGLIAVGTQAVSGVAKAAGGAIGVAGAGALAGGGSGGAAEALLQPLSRMVEAEFKSSAGEVLARPQAGGEAALTGEQVQSALEGLDLATLQAAAVELIAGRPESAEHVLASRTALSSEQIHAAVEQVNAKVQAQIAAVRAELEVAAQAAMDYAQAVLWAMSAGALVGLAACMLGGALGARRAARRALWAATASPAASATVIRDPAVVHP